MGVAIPIPRGTSSAGSSGSRLQRLRRLAWILDRSIPIGRTWRIGLDPILGLMPGIGDWLGAMMSLYILYEGARLGMPASIVMRMGGNILIETVLGAVPVIGDLFDFAWQANTRNLALIERHFQPALAGRSLGQIWFVVALFVVIVFAIIAGMVFLIARAITGAFS